MRKITDFIVSKRYFILAIFILLAIAGAVVSNNVNINNDMSKYLPSTSETRIGMDIMDKEFKNVDDSSSFNIMFKGLNSEEKIKIKNELQEVENVSSVDYDDTENYNKDDYTLYTINVDDTKDSEVAANVYNNILEKYKDYEIATNGEISNSNIEVLPLWIIVVAIAGVFLILVFMCESYIEPILFLFSILIAILLNNGTNIIFDSVSMITSSISAILQLALSMDYSIMLMDRFRQEKEVEEDKVKAMKNALYHAFKAISSSSVTTIVGLVTLVFMSFTIGRDLGLVLAKGVLFSLISIFCVLPGLILIFDKLITKTKKKSPNIKLNKVGSISHKSRYALAILFALIFVTSFLLKGNLDISYTASELDEVSKVFEKNNQIAVIYKNSEEENVSKYLKNIEQEGKVEEVLGYGNTINEKVKSEELLNKIEDLGASVDIEDYLLKIIYYKYYNPEESNNMTFDEMVKFIQNDVYNNPKMEKELDGNIKSEINRLSNFTDKTLINKSRTISDISNVLKIQKGDIEDVLVYYNSKNNNLQLTLNDFIKFINTQVITDNKYGKNIDQKTRDSLNKLSKFTDKNAINSNLTYKDMASLLGISEEECSSLYTYYISVNEMKTELTLSQFASFITKDVLTNKEYIGMFDESTVSSVKMLSTFSNTNIINKSMTAEELSKLFGMDEKVITQLSYLKYMSMGETNPETLQSTPYEFVNLILSYKDNEQIKNSISETELNNLNLLKAIMDSSLSNKTYTYKEIAEFINSDVNNIKNLYVLYTSKYIVTKLSPIEFVNFILNHKEDEMLKNSINTNIISSLNLLKIVMTSTVNNTKYSSDKMSSLLGIDKSQLSLLYGLYVSRNVNTNQKMSLKTLVNFVINDVMKNEQFSGNFDKASRSRLNTIQSIMEASENNTKYTKDEMIGILNNLSNELDGNTIELLYLYYGSAKEYDEEWRLTVEEFVNYLNDNILNDARFENFIDNTMREKIKDSKKNIDDAKELLVGDNYSRIVINTKLDLESEETFSFIQKTEDLLKESTKEFYIIGDSPMAYEMSKTFGDEFNNISILTMIAIFIVVVITFKSVIAPIILVEVIQTAVYMIMGILSVSGGSVYYLALLIVQSILMGSTIDYAILYTTYYLECRETMNRKESIIHAYNESINTILTSATILILVTFIVGMFATEITSKICITLSQGTLCAEILILVFLPALLATFDRFIVKKSK